MTPAVNMINGVLILKFLKPESTGLLNTAALLPFYISFLHFGVLTGMNRELPFAEGAGDQARVDSILRVTTRVSIFASIAGALAGLLAALISYLVGKPTLLTLGFLAAAMSACTGPIVMQTDTGLRGLHRFTRQGWAVLGTNLIGLIASGLIPLLGAGGAICRILVQDVGAILLRIRSGVRIWGGSFDFVEARRLATIGVPFLMFSSLAGVMMVVDRTVVAMLMTPKEVGELALSSVIVNSMTFVPQSLNLILFPKIARDFGQHGSSRRLRRFLWISLLFNLATILPISAVAYFSIGPLVERWFPSYASGVPAAHVACMTCVFWVYLGAGMIMGVLKRMSLYLGMLIAVVLIIAVATAVLIHLGYGILGAAWARWFGTGLMCIFSITYAWYLTSFESEGTAAVNPVRGPA